MEQTKQECIEVTLALSVSLHGLRVQTALSILEEMVCSNALVSCCLVVAPNVHVEMKIHSLTEKGEREMKGN